MVDMRRAQTAQEKSQASNQPKRRGVKRAGPSACFPFAMKQIPVAAMPQGAEMMTTVPPLLVPAWKYGAP